MSMFAVLIAVESYADTRISQVKFAEADATELSDAFDGVGIPKAQQVVLLSSQATKATVQSKLRKTLQSLSKADQMYLYYAGHGFARNAENFVTCYDTSIDDLVETSIAVEWIFSELRNSACKKVSMFLDSCESGMLASSEIRGIYTDMTRDEIEAFFSVAEHRVCFAACKPGEESHSSRHLKHGIWTYHLIEALKGEAPKVTEQGTLITSSSLQNYLADTVPRTVRETFTRKKVQTPWLYGAQSHDFLIADLGPILERKRRRDIPGASQLKQVRLYQDTLGAIRRLSGFVKRKHHVPDYAGSATEAFVARIGRKEVKDDLADAFQRLRAAFGFKRKDMQTDEYDGGGTIITPHFDYNVSISIDPDDPSGYVLRQEVCNIREPHQVFGDEFADAFPDTFEVLEFEPQKAIPIAKIIDHIEALDTDDIQVDYDEGITYCDIELSNSYLRIRVTRRAFRLSLPSASSPKALIEGFFDVQRELLVSHGIRQLPFAQEEPT